MAVVALLLGFEITGATSFGQTQVLRTFDLDTSNGVSIDVMMSEGPPNREWGRSFEPLMVDPTFTPSLLSNQSLHLVARATEPTLFEGPGTVSISGLSEDSVAAFIGQGELPQKTGVDGLTRLNFDKPTNFRFTKGVPLFIYYVTIPNLANTSFGQLFGDGDRPILSLSKNAGTPVVPIKKESRTVTTANLAKTPCQNTAKKNPASSSFCSPKSAKIKGPLVLLKEAIQKAQARQQARLVAVTAVPKPHCHGHPQKKRPGVKTCPKPCTRPVFRPLNLGGL